MPWTMEDFSYGSLKELIAKFLDRNDLTDIIPHFILLAEKKIFRNLRHLVNEAVAEYTGLPGEQFIIIPLDFLELMYNGLRVNNEVYHFIDQSQIGSIDMLGPCQFTRIQNRFYFSKAVNSDDLIELYYYADPSGMDENSETGLLRTLWDVYLYASLCEAEGYLKNDPRIKLWKIKFQEAINDLNAQGKRFDVAMMDKKINQGSFK